VARATKTKKSPAKISSRQMEIIRKRLVSRRDEITDLYMNDLRAGQKLSDSGVEDLIDRANDAYNREFMLSLSGSERDALLEVEKAIVRLESGGYGDCDHCTETIPAKRLQAVPWARYCIDCQELAEQGLLQD
jgi:DnaK suppressor protein